MTSLLKRIMSHKGMAALLGVVLTTATVGLLPPSASAAESFGVGLKLVTNCTGYNGGVGVRLYHDSTDETTLYRVKVSAVVDGKDLGTRPESGVIAAGGSTTSYFGLWGDEFFPETVGSLKGAINWTVSYNTGTLEEPVWEPLPSADGSGNYDCTPAPTDSDGDGVDDSLDKCPGTPAGATVNVDGCASSQLDSDSDGVNNDKDRCSGTASGASVDSNGCSAAQRDSDDDGVSDADDLCPGTPVGEAVNADGCSLSQIDTDGDNVFDSVDRCPTQTGPASNGGCPVVTNPGVTYLVSGKIGKICQTAKGCKTTIVVNHLGGRAAPVLTATLSNGAKLSIKPRRENANTSVYVVTFPKGVSIVSVSAALPSGAQLH